MSKLTSIKPLAASIGALALGTGLTLSAAQAADNPFGSTELSAGYMQLAGDHKGMEGKCGEGRCGEDKGNREGKCGEGKCGEGKCGEGKCGEEKGDAEGKCGEGKCGEA